TGEPVAESTADVGAIGTAEPDVPAQRVFDRIEPVFTVPPDGPSLSDSTTFADAPAILPALRTSPADAPVSPQQRTPEDGPEQAPRPPPGSAPPPPAYLGGQVTGGPAVGAPASGYATEPGGYPPPPPPGYGPGYPQPGYLQPGYPGTPL